MKTTRATIRIGDTLHVFIGTAGDESQRQAFIEAKRAGLVADGHGMEYEGRREWLADEPITDKDGQYTWDKTGNRVKHRRVLCIRSASGDVTRYLQRYVWKSP